MADDIEDLLREVEEKYLPRPQEKNPTSSSISPMNPSKSSNNPPVQTAEKQRDQSVAPKTTTRAHSSDIVCRELEDELSDLLDEAGGLSDAAAVGLRCKRSPRRSASARELMGGKSLTSSVMDPPGFSQLQMSHHATARQEFANKVSAAVDAAASNQLKTLSLTGGVRSAPPFVQHHHINVSGARTTHVSIDAVVVEKQKCYPIYVSGVIDSIDNSQSVRHYRWRPGTDYLFLRNHMPEFDRVRVKLSTAKFCRAYACQCKFVTVKDLVDLTKLGPEFASTWICLGH
ncbi:hypothetical protein DAPPUDRAFT_331025 [Daphnia pulex]|uniref:Cilia- and flagella-associated protein 418 n=1 Tax=Daphnia pulex TaxID=6669 RepID=E9HLA0_DAPPU|nr:hypothetical protein DAPPUDRAFT_331025 [Daphnia pulex]|eukprot:EFX67464.1 hypothetical protein DAPPUDRAFT_331025 [Daphnia pulex]